MYTHKRSLSLDTSVSSSRNICFLQIYGHKSSPHIHKYIDTDINIHAQEPRVHVYAHTHTHTITDRSPMCTNSVTHRTTECTQKVTHVPTQSHPCIQAVHTHTLGSKATGPSLPVACTMHSSGVRGCTFDRRELAGRTLVGTAQDPPIRWSPVGMRS